MWRERELVKASSSGAASRRTSENGGGALSYAGLPDVVGMVDHHAAYERPTAPAAQRGGATTPRRKSPPSLDVEGPEQVIR